MKCGILKDKEGNKNARSNPRRELVPFAIGGIKFSKRFLLVRVSFHGSDKDMYSKKKDRRLAGKTPTFVTSSSTTGARGRGLCVRLRGDPPSLERQTSGRTSSSRLICPFLAGNVHRTHRILSNLRHVSFTSRPIVLQAAQQSSNQYGAR